MKRFNKSLLLCPEKYSLNKTLKEILMVMSEEVYSDDSRHFISNRMQKIRTQMFRFPFSIRNRFDEKFLYQVNTGILSKYRSIQPELVLVYNSEFLLPETCIEIKKHSKLVFFLGDNPYFTPMNNFFLTILGYGDLILAPDTFWVEQLRTIGYQNTHYFIPGMETSSYFELNSSELDRFTNVAETELLYSGMCYVDSWGYKKALFMSKFAQFNLQLYGSKHWKKWFRFFPELENHFTLSSHIPITQLNAMYNKTKLVPVDGNPGVLKGFHLRLFEALAAGALPIVEYRQDVEKQLFKTSGIQLPLIRDYRMSADIAKYYLSNDNERLELVLNAKQFILDEYSAFKNSELLLSYLDNGK